jgi:GTP cyclohydrolase I
MMDDPEKPTAAAVDAAEITADTEAMAAALAEFLRAAGLPEAAGGEAPSKAATAWAEELLAGYRTDPQSIVAKTWPDEAQEMVAVNRIPFVSVCAHHLLPFYGEAHLAYLPGGKLTGLSRLTALVDCLARRLQVQERLTEEICDALMGGLGARGAACLLVASHDCVGARRLEHRGSKVQTLAYRGVFADQLALQESFLRLALGPGDPPEPGRP